MKVKVVLALVAVIISLALAVHVRADEARSYVLSYQFVRHEDKAELCFVSKGGVMVCAFDSPCADEKAYNSIEKDLLRALGARRQLLKGLHMVYTKHNVFYAVPGTRNLVDVNGSRTTACGTRNLCKSL